MTNNKNATRYYSGRQERKIAKVLGGKMTSNSGASRFSAGDIVNNLFLIEAKTKTTESKSFSIKKEWLEKNKEEAFAMNKSYNALCFDFGDDSRYYIIDEKTFKLLNELLEMEEEV